MFTLRIDDRHLKDLQRLLRNMPRALPQVMSRGLNRTATQTRTQLARLISHYTKMGVREAGTNIYVHRAHYQKWRAAVEVSNFRPSIISLKPEQTRSGVRYSLGRKRILLRHAFIARGQQKGLNVWLRSLYVLGHRKYINWKGRKMEAVYPQRAPGIWETVVEYGSAEVNRIYRESQAQLEKNIHDQVNLILKRRAS